MAYEVKPNTGSMFANDKKESDNHPDRKGSALIGGVEYWVSGWIKKTQEGKPWLSLAFKPKETQSAPPPRTGPAPNKYAQQKGGSGFEDMPDDRPW